MYISEFWIGLILGIISTITILVIIAVKMDDK